VHDSTGLNPSERNQKTAFVDTSVQVWRFGAVFSISPN